LFCLLWVELGHGLRVVLEIILEEKEKEKEKKKKTVSFLL